MTHHLRRSDRAITDDSVVERILRDGRFTTIALAADDGPYLVTLSYGYDAAARRLCFHVANAGRKLEIIARDPRACATVIADHGYNAGACEHPFESVVMFGTMRVIEDADEARQAMRTLIGHLETEESAGTIWERNRLDTDEPFGSFTSLVFEIDTLTAKAGK